MPVDPFTYIAAISSSINILKSGAQGLKYLKERLTEIDKNEIKHGVNSNYCSSLEVLNLESIASNVRNFFDVEVDLYNTISREFADRIVLLVIELIKNSFEKGGADCNYIIAKKKSFVIYQNSTRYNPRQLLCEKDSGQGKESLEKILVKHGQNLAMNYHYSEKMMLNEVHFELNPNYIEFKNISGPCLIYASNRESTARVYSVKLDTNIKWEHRSREELIKLANEKVNELSDDCNVVEIVVVNDFVGLSDFHNFYGEAVRILLKRNKKICLYITDINETLIQDYRDEMISDPDVDESRVNILLCKTN